VAGILLFEVLSMIITKPITLILIICLLSYFLQFFEVLDGPLNPSNCTDKTFCGDDWVGYKDAPVAIEVSQK